MRMIGSFLRHLEQSPEGLLHASGDTLALFGPAANNPPSTNPAGITFRNGHMLLTFNDTTQEIAIFEGVMPRNYGGGGITVTNGWMAASAVTGTGGWDATFERDANAGDDMDTDSFATAQTITAATVPGTSGVLKTTSVAITAGAAGTDSIAAGDGFRLRIRRDVANDTAIGDLQLMWVEVKET